ncbi:MaoC family dehydratase N-terminal domain-containing protein [Zymomonas sp.]|uniref:FAS1-like dehydratase domain-containing protein n=1 Tax=Zymomonas sp. TaxID=2068624 RepID=UPI0025F323A4|nr:MaoC family dehydratase N-terminal domain-containing protein [Zymomonas sp.]MCA1956202.1 MaoC family dehydratase N-terminal domain-containing protein [Zymomonas sp.]
MNSTSSSETELDVEFLRGWIGREMKAEDIISEELAKRYIAVLDLPPSALNKGAIAPQLIHFCLAPAVVSGKELGHDGHPSKGGFLPPVPLPRRMWAGGDIHFLSPLHIGEKLCRHSRIVDVVPKKGRSGLLCFVTVEHEMKVEGEVRIRERQDIVYREAATKPTPQPATPLPTVGRGEHSQDIIPTTPLLFRYSAITFNSHRIHYDRNYAVNEEHYPALVVHGPLQASLLIHFAAKIKKAQPKQFLFQSRSPLFDNADFSLNAQENEKGLSLWTCKDGGAIAMKAEAVFDD